MRSNLLILISCLEIAHLDVLGKIADQAQAIGHVPQVLHRFVTLFAPETSSVNGVDNVVTTDYEQRFQRDRL